MHKRVKLLHLAYLPTFVHAPGHIDAGGGIVLLVFQAVSIHSPARIRS